MAKPDRERFDRSENFKQEQNFIFRNAGRKAAKMKNWSENAQAAEDDEVLEDLGLAGQDEIRAIDAALVRMDEGTYGECVTCGEPISEERLDILPYTPFCKVHAQRH